MKKDLKNITLGIILLFGLIFALNLVSADLTQPATSATIAGTTVLNATNGTIVNMTNCTFYAQSASTANSSWANLGFASNLTQNPANINITFNSITLEDSNDYIFNATCRNASNFAQSTTKLSITIDNTIPQSATSLSPADANIKKTTSGQVYSGTVVDANTTSCTLYIGIGGGNFENFAMTYATTSCTYTDSRYTGSNKNGNYYWYIKSSDGTNTTNSGTQINYVQIPPASGGVANQQQANVLSRQQALALGDTSDNTNQKTGVIIIIAIALIGGYFYFKKR